MRVCVTGAPGFLGSHIVRSLLDAGHGVRAVVRDAARASHLGPMGDVEVREADLLGPPGFVEGCDAVIHAASPVRLAARDPMREIVEPAVALARSVIQAANACSVRRIVMTSSVAAVVDPLRPVDHLFTETDWNETTGIEEPYPFSKTLAEREARSIAPEPGRLVCLCPTFVLGPVLARAHLRSSPSLVRSLMKGSMPALPRIGMGIVDVRDVARAHVLALEKESPSPRYILSSEPLWTADVAAILKERFPLLPVKVRRLPDVLAYAACIFDRRLSFAYLRRNLGRMVRVSTDLAHTELSIAFRPARESIVDTARSILEAGWL